MKKILYAQLFIICFSAFALAQIPVKTLVQISRAEDELRYDKTLEDLMKNADARLCIRAALAAGRIGDEKAIPALTHLLENDTDENVRVTAAFALGETESIKAADAILKILESKDSPKVRARAVEAAGKIVAANAKNEKSKKLGEAILATLDFEDRKRSGPFLNVIELGLTAVLRSRPENAEKVLVKFVKAYTPQIRANALNALTRLRAKNANNEARELLQKDEDATVRANAARVLGAAEDKDAFDLLLNAAVSDKDSRVRVAAIRSLGSLKDGRAADKLLERGEKLFADYKKSKFANPIEKSELLEIATAIGLILRNAPTERAISFLGELREADEFQSAETEIALVRVFTVEYPVAAPDFKKMFASAKASNSNKNWRTLDSFVQGFGEAANVQENENNKGWRDNSADILRKFITDSIFLDAKVDVKTATMVLPNALTAFAGFKTDDLSAVMRKSLKHRDLFIRASAAGVLAEQPSTKENIAALKTAFAESLKTDKKYNDAQLAILSALVKLDKAQSFESLRFALTAPDYLVRKHAANLIKQNDLTKEFSNIEKMVGNVKPYNPKTGTRLGQILNSEADYVRTVSRKNGTAKAVFTTEKGNFTIDLTPEDAPLTVDNFIKLARSNYFNGVSVHRVVPNFVMQDGDPRGDGNGGPGYSIRCELNMLEYERGAVGMALSGKDTGGSQWFVTHISQPHLDGGYTVFGRVNETDMQVVDQVVRGDKILSVKIVEQTAVRKR